MKPNQLISTCIAVVVVLAGMLFTYHLGQARVYADSSAKFSYLEAQAGTSNSGGKHFIDLRNGNYWDCTTQACKLEGRFPLEQTDHAGK